MAITSPGSGSSASSSTPASTLDITHTAAAGTDFLLLVAGWRPTVTLDTIEVWDTGQSFTEIWKSGNAHGSDVGIGYYGLVSPTIQTNTITLTWSANTDLQWAILVNYAGNDTASVAAATNLLETIDDTTGIKATLPYISAGSSGNALVASGAIVGADGIPSSADNSFVELFDFESGGGAGGAADHSVHYSHLLDAAPSACTITFTAGNDEIAGAYLEIVAASGAISDSISAAVDLTESFADVVIAADSLSNPVDLTEALASIITTPQSVSEAIDLTESIASQITTGQSISETVDFSDTQDGINVVQDSISAQVDFADAQTVIATAAAAIQAAADFGETWATIATQLASQSEIVEFSDTQAGLIAGIQVSISADLTLAEAFADLLIATAAQSENVDLGESSAGSLPGVAVGISENIDLSDTQAGTATANAALTGAVDFAATHAAVVQAITSIKEPVTLADIQTSLMTVGMSFSEAVTLADAWASNAGEIAAAVRIIVAARNRRIVVSPRSRRISVKKLN